MKRPRRKRILCILASLLLALLLAYLCLPHYARQALIHLMPVIDDLETFHRDTVRHDAANRKCLALAPCQEL